MLPINTFFICLRFCAWPNWPRWSCLHPLHSFERVCVVLVPDRQLCGAKGAQQGWGCSVWTPCPLSVYCSATAAPPLSSDVTAFQGEDKWLSVRADEQQGECQVYWVEGPRHRRKIVAFSRIADLPLSPLLVWLLRKENLSFHSSPREIFASLFICQRLKTLVSWGRCSLWLLVYVCSVYHNMFFMPFLWLGVGRNGYFKFCL